MTSIPETVKDRNLDTIDPNTWHRIRKQVARQSTDETTMDIIGLQETLQEALGKLAHERRGILESASITADAIIREEQMQRANRQWILLCRRWQLAARSDRIAGTTDKLATDIVESLEDAINRAATAEQERDAANAGYLAAHKRMMELEAAHKLLSKECQRVQNDVIALVEAEKAVAE